MLNLLRNKRLINCKPYTILNRNSNRHRFYSTPIINNPQNVFEALVESPILSSQEISTPLTQLGDIKLYGLGMDWWPSSFFELGMEAFHLYSELPWMASIVAISVLMRLSVTPFMFKSFKFQKDMEVVQPKISAIQEKIKKAVALKDKMSEGALKQEMFQEMRNNKVNPLSAISNMLVQAFLTYGLFSAVRSMSLANLPGFSDKLFGIISLTDTSVVLSGFTAICLIMMMRMTMSSKQLSNPYMQWMPWAFVPMSFGFFCYQPVAMHTFMMTTAIVTFIQTKLIKSRLSVLPDTRVLISKDVATHSPLTLKEASRVIASSKQFLKQEKLIRAESNAPPQQQKSCG